MRGVELGDDGALLPAQALELRPGESTIAPLQCGLQGVLYRELLLLQGGQNGTLGRRHGALGRQGRFLQGGKRSTGLLYSGYQCRLCLRARRLLRGSDSRRLRIGVLPPLAVARPGLVGIEQKHSGRHKGDRTQSHPGKHFRILSPRKTAPGRKRCSVPSSSAPALILFPKYMGIRQESPVFWLSAGLHDPKTETLYPGRTSVAVALPGAADAAEPPQWPRESSRFEEVSPRMVLSRSLRSVL